MVGYWQWTIGVTWGFGVTCFGDLVTSIFGVVLFAYVPLLKNYSWPLAMSLASYFEACDHIQMLWYLIFLFSTYEMNLCHKVPHGIICHYVVFRIQQTVGWYSSTLPFAPVCWMLNYIPVTGSWEYMTEYSSEFILKQLKNHIKFHNYAQSSVCERIWQPNFTLINPKKNKAKQKKLKK